jgi:hypothetical protein
MNDLVQRLSTGTHPVEVSLRPERSLRIFKECLDRGFVHIKFTDTRGGTELGVRLDQTVSDQSNADLDNGSGTIRLAGPLTLNYVKVRCVADVDVATLTGRGRLELLADEVSQ